MIDFLNTNSGAVSGLSTIVLVIITAYYAWQSRQTVQEMARQTNLQQMPVVVLYVRDTRDSMSNPADFDEQKNSLIKLGAFLIRTEGSEYPTPYYLALRNVGRGVAFNLDVETEFFRVNKYRGRFLAPEKDEQPFSVVLKDGKIPKDLSVFQGNIFKITCTDISGGTHSFVYKIVEFERKRVDFIEKK